MVEAGENHPGRSSATIAAALFLSLVALAVQTASTDSFVAIADARFEEALYAFRNPFLLGFFGWITFFGNAVVVAGLTATALMALLSSKAYRVYAFGLAAAVAGAVTTGYVLKMLMARARPGGLIPAAIETSFSFPSGHATASLALFGFMTYLLCKMFPARKSFLLIASAILIGSVGFSRLYLGVHFPSDVLAGYLVGGLWLLGGIEIVRHLRRKEAICRQEASLRY